MPFMMAREEHEPPLLASGPQYSLLRFLNHFLFTPSQSKSNSDSVDLHNKSYLKFAFTKVILRF